MVSDQPREDVQTACRALGIPHRRSAMPHVQVFEQGNDVNAAALQYPTLADVHLVHREVFKPLLNCRTLSRQEACAHAIRNRPKSKIQAGGLKLIILDRVDRLDFPGYPDQMFQTLRRQYPRRMRRDFGLLADIVEDTLLHQDVIPVSHFRHQVFFFDVPRCRVRSTSYSTSGYKTRPLLFALSRLVQSGEMLFRRTDKYRVPNNQTETLPR